MFEDPFVLDTAPLGKGTASLRSVPSHIFTLFPPPSEEVNIYGKNIEENMYKYEGEGQVEKAPFGSSLGIGRKSDLKLLFK